jgi:hypothetical protein
MIGTGFSPTMMFSGKPDCFSGQDAMQQLVSECLFDGIYDRVELSDKALEANSKTGAAVKNS